MPYSETNQTIIEIARVKLPVPTGVISGISWFDGAIWQSLTGPLDLDIDWPMRLKIYFNNTGKRKANCYLDAIIISPSGQFLLTSPIIQVAARGSGAVEVPEFILDQIGSWSADLVLMMEST